MDTVQVFRPSCFHFATRMAWNRLSLQLKVITKPGQFISIHFVVHLSAIRSVMNCTLPTTHGSPIAKQCLAKLLKLLQIMSTTRRLRKSFWEEVNISVQAKLRLSTSAQIKGAVSPFFVLRKM